MNKQEISITEYELQDSNGHLGELKSNWASVPRVSSSFLTLSKGWSAGTVDRSIDTAVQVSDSFQRLLDNSLDFFTQLGVSFRESDEKAAQYIDSITNCQG